MNINMYVSKSKAQATSTSAVCRHHIDGYVAVQQAILQFTSSSPLLRGKAYDSAKAFYSAVLYPLVQAGILLTEATEKAVKEFPERYQSEVDSGDLKQIELEEKIRQADQLIIQAQGIRQTILSSSLPEVNQQTQMKLNQGLLEIYQTEKRELEEKLQKLITFNASSPAIFSEIASLKQAVSQGLTQTKSAWSSSTGSFTVPSQNDLKWVSWVQNKWATYEAEHESQLDEESKLYLNKAKEDYQSGAISKETFESIKSGIITTGAAFIKKSH
ncbi:hypothetical protein MFLO_13775 [Listeria floridensis FSL S10-1187]|uniref:LXG domain-containing protein n=1 Tax=Listeria floridensis FSL S10-1187 TaxID=1265817 RepID=A0ABP3AWC3_9LIST|nr:T7SS effector LXG polymorphic toxin [Listeria floridensis]EUJ26945.1 hypothetical protein MFLO_13775 [Listeria floridensis FSL S10-1187]